MGLIIKDVKSAAWVVGALFVVGLVLYFKFRATPYEIEMEKAYALKRAHPQLTVFDGFEEPPIPNREESEKTLLGTDANKNGLRDDVEIWINRTQSDPGIRNALRQLHLIYQEIMTVKNPEKKNLKPETEKVNRLFQRESDAGQCLYSYFQNLDDHIKLYQLFYKTIQNRNEMNGKQFLDAADQLSDAIGMEGGLSSEEKKKRYCK